MALRLFFPEGNHPRLDLSQFEALESSRKQRERVEKRWKKEDPKKAEPEFDGGDF